MKRNISYTIRNFGMTEKFRVEIIEIFSPRDPFVNLSGLLKEQYKFKETLNRTYKTEK